MKRLLAPILAIAILAPIGGQAGILEDLDRHYDPKALFQAGPSVLTEAKGGKVSSIALLARYFDGGERGFPVNHEVARKLYQEAYDRGDWSSAYNLGKKSEEAKDFRRAAVFYAITYLVASDENRRRPSHLPPPDMSHLAYADIRYLFRSGAIPEKEADGIAIEAKDEARRRGFITGE